MMKKGFLGLMVCGLVFQVQLLAQTGLQTDTDGSITGTAGTEYLWVNEANFPDESFRYYLQQMVASETTGGGSYVIPANITYLRLSSRCCSRTVGYLISSQDVSIGIEDVPEEDRASVSDFLNSEEAKEAAIQEACDDGWARDEVESWDIYYVKSLRKVSRSYISAIEVDNGIHKIYKRDTVYYLARVYMSDWGYGYGNTQYIPGSARSQQLYTSHKYHVPTGNVSNLTGINYFTNLRGLECSHQQLTSLDLTALIKLDSLDCSNNRLTDLRVNLVAHDWWDRYHWSATDSTYIDASKDVAHQRVYLDCSYNYLTNLNNVTVTPTAEGQLVNIEGSYSNNRILAFPQGKHPYFDLDQGIFAYGRVGIEGAWGAWEPYTDFLNTYMFPNISQMSSAQVSLFSGLGIDPSSLPFRYSSMNTGLSGYIALYLHPYDPPSDNNNHEQQGDDGRYYTTLSGILYSSSQQNFGVNLSVIDKSRSRVGVSVPSNLRDDENSFETVLLMDNSYPPKVEQGGDTHYAFNGSGSTADLDYCHAPVPVSYSLFNGYTAWTGTAEFASWGFKSLSCDNAFDLSYDLSALDINKYGDWFDPNINPYYADPAYGTGYEFMIGGLDGYGQRVDIQTHDVTLTADHYVMYVNPISEDTEGKCNGTAIFDYDAIIPEGLEAFIVTGYTNGGEADRFKTGRLNLVKVGDGDGADGYKRVIPANNPVCLRTKQTVSEGQAANNMSTTGLYPFHNNDQRTNYPCEDPNDEQFEPLELIPSSLFEGNKLRGVLNTSGQSYTAGTVLTLGRYKDNNEHKIGFWTYNGTKLNMHRVYILKSDLNMPSEAKGCTLDFGYENSTTPIGGVGLGDVEHSGDTWYTLQGIRLAEKPTLKGIYIHNGKKVVVRSDDVVPSSNHTAATEDIYTDNF